MSIYKFNKLTLEEKLSTLELIGAMIGVRQEDGNRVYLFQIDAFYVELYYTAKRAVLIKMLIFSSTHKLKPYLDKIKLERLLTGI